MRLIDLPRTTSFRLALVFLALFAAASATLFGFLYLRTHQFLIQHVDQWLNREAPGAFQMTLPDLTKRLAARTAASTNPDTAFVLYGPDGTRVAGDPVPVPAALRDGQAPFDFRVPLGGTPTRFRGVAHRFPDGSVALIAQNMHETREFDEAFVATVFWGVVLTAVLGMAGALVVAAGTVQRFDAAALAIQRIIGGDLSRRLPAVGTSGDMNRLAHVVNSMLDDIERLMHDVKGVCDGIAHDLRTPLTRMLAGLERAQRRGGDTQAYASAVDDAIVETRSVLKTFSALLRIAEVEDGARRAGFAVVDLAVVAADVLEFYEPLAEEAGISLTFDKEGPSPFNIIGDASLLFEAIGNLLDNAIKFTPRNGHVRVAVTNAADGLSVKVSDTGCGISDADLKVVFNRFHRSESSRHTPGNGLGLSLVAAVARLHAMELTIENHAAGCQIALSQGNGVVVGMPTERSHLAF